MKILAISDEECPALWDYYTPGRLADYDLIISCGDLNAKYLSFLVTMAKCPVLYVHGNHDVNYDQVPPRAVTASTGTSWNITASAFWGLAAAAGIIPAPTSIPTAKCARASQSFVGSSSGWAAWTLW